MYWGSTPLLGLNDGHLHNSMNSTKRPGIRYGFRFQGASLNINVLVTGFKQAQTSQKMEAKRQIVILFAIKVIAEKRFVIFFIIIKRIRVSWSFFQ